MDSRPLGSIGSLFITSAFASEAAALIYDLRWGFVLIIVLLIADAWFSISHYKMDEQKKAKADPSYKMQKVRKSNAWRRSLIKLVDYTAVMIIGALMGMAIGETLGWFTHLHGGAIGLIAGCVCEAESIKGHFCALHGMEDKFSIKAFLISLLSSKAADYGKAVNKALEDNDKKDDKTEKGQ